LRKTLQLSFALITTTVCIVRHGETAWNAATRLQGQTDVPLSEVGLAQARAAAAFLREEKFDACYASDLARAWRTAELIAEPTGLRLTPEPRLRERNYGVFQALTYEEAEERFPHEYARFKARDASCDFITGESLNDFAHRVRECMRDIVLRHRGQRLLVVAHGGVLDIIHRMASGQSLWAPRDFEIPNAGLNWLEHDERGWFIERWAVREHLAAARDELPG
jgi:probable phosphoglycerate mutase